jgi:uncharacterized protein YaeQ
MAQGATVYAFEIGLNDADRHVYEALSFRVAQHPSETADFLCMRVLAYCLEYTPGICFSRGICEPEEPAIVLRDATGAWRSWIDIGQPEAARLHKAAKAAPRVAVYSHRPVEAFLERLAGERIYRAESIEIYAPELTLLRPLVERLDRRMKFDLAVSDHQLYLSLGADTLTGALIAHRIGGSR